MSNIDWSQLVTKAMKDAEAEAVLRAHQLASETAWQVEELATIADQLLAIEDGDPAAFPGTARQWRDYRTQVRAWKEGHPDFPDGNKRPVRPS